MKKVILSLLILYILFPAKILAATNLISNSSVESSSNSIPNKWSTGNWGSNNATFSFADNGYDGSKSLKVEMSSYNDGDAKWYFDEVTVKGNKDYTYSDYYKSDTDSRIVIQYNSNGSYSYSELSTVSASTDWKQFSKTFTTPSGVTSLTIFHLLSSNGTLQTDNFSLTEVSTSGSAFSQGMVTFSFDDGWTSQFKNAYPVLKTNNYKGTFYIVTSFIGTDMYMTNTQIKNMFNSGQNIESHSVTHPELPLLTVDLQKNEIFDSLNTLNQFGYKVTSFAYPYGEYTSDTLDLVKQAGYKSARTAVVADSGFNYKNTDKYLLKNKSVETDVSLATIKGWIDTAKNNKSWLILVFHQIDTSGSQYSTTPTKFKNIVSYVKSKNVKVVTVPQGVNLMQ